MRSILSLSWLQRLALMRVAGFLDRQGFIDRNGQFWGEQRGDLHSDVAIRYIKSNDGSNKEMLKRVRSIAKREAWHELYRLMASEYGLIRVSDRCFDVLDFDRSLRLVYDFVKTHGYGDNEELIIENVFTGEHIVVTVEDLGNRDSSGALMLERLLRRAEAEDGVERQDGGVI